MRPDFVVIGSVSLQDIAQVRFAEHDEVVELFAANRTDQPLNVPVLPRRAWRHRAISDPHCANASGVRWTERAVAVANQMTRHCVPGKGIDHLSRDPVCGELLILGKPLIRHSQEETLTVTRLGLPANLERVLSSTNLIENLFSRVREIGRRVKRWQSGTMVLRWTAAGVLEAQRGFRKLAGYRALPALVAALRAHDAQLDRTEGKLDTARNAA